MNAGTWLAAALLFPLALLVARISRRARGYIADLLPLAPVPALLAAIAVPEGTSLVLPQALLGLTLALDRPGAMLLGAASLLWSAGGVYARALLRAGSNSGQFTTWWLMTLTGSLGVFLAADIAGFYLLFSLVSLAAYGLIVHDGTPTARGAADLYVALALLGEAFLLVGLVLLAVGTPDGSLMIKDVVAALPGSPWRTAAMTFVILGFGVKIGLVPFHVWMPLTYAAAPIAAAAVLSGAAVKAGVIGLIRFLPFDSALSGWGALLVSVGLFAAFYGVVIGIAQSNPKVVLAYSSVSQMGFLAAVLGMGIATVDRALPTAAALYAVHHTLVKGGLFLALGVIALPASRRFWMVFLPVAILALSLAGLPLTGGQLAKVAVKGSFGDGLVGLLVQLSAAGSTVLMLHFLSCLYRSIPNEAVAPPSAELVMAWLTIAVAALAAPWLLSPAVDSAMWTHALTPREQWSALWPILAGGFLAIVLLPWQYRLPRVPEGDILAVGERFAPIVRDCGSALERIDRALRQWPAAGVCALLIMLLTAWMLAAP